jgi:hypothetical protein
MDKVDSTLYIAKDQPAGKQRKAEVDELGNNIITQIKGD